MEKIIASAYKVKPEFIEKKQLVYKNPNLWNKYGMFDDIYTLRIGRHHAEILHMFNEQVDQTTSGFYTSWGRYVDREEAAQIALKAKQCHEPLIMGDRLDSSDIFDFDVD